MKNSDAYIFPFYLFGAASTWFAVALSLDVMIIPDVVTNNEVLFNTIGFYWFTCLVAHTHAIMDSKKIKAGLGVNHTNVFMKRILWIGSAALIMQMNVLHMLPAAFLFSTLFNVTLNDERGKVWFYISNSNVYDRIFLKLTGAKTSGNIETKPIVLAGKIKVITESSLAVILFIVVLILGI